MRTAARTNELSMKHSVHDTSWHVAVRRREMAAETATTIAAEWHESSAATSAAWADSDARAVMTTQEAAPSASATATAKGTSLASRA